MPTAPFTAAAPRESSPTVLSAPRRTPAHDRARRPTLVIPALLLVLLLLLPTLAACSPPASRPSLSSAARIESGPDKDRKRVILTATAVDRLGIRTTPVREDPIVRRRKLGGAVVPAIDPSAAGRAATRAGSDRVWVRVAVSEAEFNRVDRKAPALVFPLATNGPPALPAQPSQSLADASGDNSLRALYYQLEGSAHSLVPQQRVIVEVLVAGSGGSRKVVPYSALIYDLAGKTWVYTNPQPLVFLRQPVTVDYIDGDSAMLAEGPPTGSQIVAVGAAALFSAESGVSR